MRQPLRDQFDEILEAVIASLPPGVAKLLDEVPVVVDDLPSPAVLRDLGMREDEGIELCGLHTGSAFTERSVEHPDLPSEIQLYREGIVDQAGGWGGDSADERIREEIRITLLHEIGHQFGLDEEDLERLGYD
ncbi:MAG: metallopeptidase family protein [Phycisphaerales bacterium]